jgi:hypothetical protein
MPRIEKVKLPVVRTTKKKKTLKTKKIKASPVEYYNCLLTKAQND